MLHKLSILILCILITGCASRNIKPIKSDPPYSKIIVEKPFLSTAFAMKDIDMPDDIYTPKYEDDNGYYYQASKKIIVHSGEFARPAQLIDGGLYLKKNESRPEILYLAFDTITSSFVYTRKIDPPQKFTLVK